jgi:hypothetical protein
MTQIQTACSHCGRVNELSAEPPWEDKFAENLPKGLFKGAAVTLATLITLPAGGIGGLLLGGVLYGDAVVKFLVGKKVTCKYCGREFIIK